MKPLQLSKNPKGKPRRRHNSDTPAPAPTLGACDVNKANLYRQENFNICLVNARSIKTDKKGDDFRSFVEDTAFPLFAVTETWLPNSAANDPSFGPIIPNYSWIGQVGRANRSGGGVAWCAHDNIFAKIKVIDTGLPLSDYYQISHIQLEGLDLVCVYIVPGMPQEVHETVFNYMSQLNDKNAVVLGDFNLPDINFVEGRATGGRANTIFEHFCDKVTFQQLIEEPTRGSNILDLVFSSDPEVVESAQVLQNVHLLYGWDHKPVTASIARFIETDSDFKVTLRNFKKMDKKLYRRILAEADWSGTEANGLQIKIRENIQKAISLAIPTREVSIRRLLKEKHVSRETAAATKLAAKLHAIYRQCPSVTNYGNYTDMNAYKRFLRRRDENNYATINVTKDAKTFWGFVHRTTNKHRGIPTLVHHGTEITDDQGKADTLAEGFMDVYKDRTVFSGPFSPTDPNTPLMPDFTFSIEKTKKAIKQMKAGSAPGVDGIGAKFYKLASDILAEPLTRLFQISYDTGVVPEEWKESMITALYKNKGPRNLRTSYRPISLLLVSFKLMEGSMKFDLCSFFDDNNLWSPCQHAFRSRRSTLTCLLEATDQVERWLDDPSTKYAAYVSLDAMKAFDAVTFYALGRSLVDQGLPEKGIKWFIEGLSDRRFRVKVGGAFSDLKHPSSGIQQGSILSPLCWNLHMQTLQAIVHDVPGAEEVCKLHIYADDICLSFRSRCPADEDTVQQVLARYEEVALEKSMYVHPEKSQLLRIGKRSDRQFMIGGKVIPEVEHLDALGVTLSANNKNEAHFQKVLKKVRQRVFLLRKLVKADDVVVRTIVWDLMMGSIIRYGYPAIKEFNTTQLRKLQSLQRLWMSRAKACTLSCPHRKYRSSPTSPSLDAAHCPKHVGPSPIFQTLAHEDLMVYYDLCAGKMNAAVHLPQSARTPISTRLASAGGFLQLPPISSVSRSRAYSHRIVKLVNSLPSDLRLGLEEIRAWKVAKSNQIASVRVFPHDVAYSAPTSENNFLDSPLATPSPTGAPDSRSRPSGGRAAIFRQPLVTEYPLGPTSNNTHLPWPKLLYTVQSWLRDALTMCGYFSDFQYVWILAHMEAASLLAPDHGRHHDLAHPPALPPSLLSLAILRFLAECYNGCDFTMVDGASENLHLSGHQDPAFCTLTPPIMGPQPPRGLQNKPNNSMQHGSAMLPLNPRRHGVLDVDFSPSWSNVLLVNFLPFLQISVLHALLNERGNSHMLAASSTTTTKGRYWKQLEKPGMTFSQKNLKQKFFGPHPTPNMSYLMSYRSGEPDPFFVLQGPHGDQSLDHTHAVPINAHMPPDTPTTTGIRRVSLSDTKCPKMSSSHTSGGELGPISVAVNHEAPFGERSRRFNNESGCSQLSNSSQATPANAPQLQDERKKLLSREAYKRGIRSRSLYSRPLCLDTSNYKPNVAIPKAQEIQGRQFPNPSVGESGLSTVSNTRSPFFL